MRGMKLYDFKQAPNPRRVRMFLAEKGVSVPLEQVDIFQRVNRQPAFLAKNPLGGIPVLELDDGTCLAESVAICRYFEALHPEPALFGRDAREQGLVEMWNRRVELVLLNAIGMVWGHGSPLTAKVVQQIPANVEPNRKRAAQFLELLDRELGTRAFIAGDRLSIADITALCAIDFARMVEIAPDPKLENVARWHAALSARPSASA
jgi:glutathione S-transferase